MAATASTLSSGEIHMIHTNMETLANQLPPAQASAMHYALNSSRPGFEDKAKALAGVVMHIKAKLDEKCDHPVSLVGNLNNWDPMTGLHAWLEEGATVNFYEREFILQIPKEWNDKILEFKLVTQGKWQTDPNNVVDLKHYGHLADITIDHVKFA